MICFYKFSMYTLLAVFASFSYFVLGGFVTLSRFFLYWSVGLLLVQEFLSCLFSCSSQPCIISSPYTINFSPSPCKMGRRSCRVACLLKCVSALALFSTSCGWLSYRPASLCSLSDRHDNPMSESTISPQSGTTNLASGCK